MKTKYYHSKTIRTDGYKSQPEYDELISDLDISSLRFLKQKKQKDINEFRSTHDLNNPEYAEKYKVMQQQFVMITQEIKHRQVFNESSKEEEWYDPETGFIIDEHGNYKGAVYYDENEESMVYSNSEDNVESVSFEEEDEDEFDYQYADKDLKDSKMSWEDWCKEKGLQK